MVDPPERLSELELDIQEAVDIDHGKDHYRFCRRRISSQT